MRNTITRSLVESTIYGCVIEIVDGQPTTKNLDPVVVQGKVSTEKALKHLVNAYGKMQGMAVVKVAEEVNTYEISVADFMAHAKKVEKPESQTN